MTDQEHADAIKRDIITLRKTIKEAQNSGLKAVLIVDGDGFISVTRVSRNFYN